MPIVPLDSPKFFPSLARTLNPYQANIETSVWHARLFPSTFYRPARILTEE
jgi:hypothetical protein